MATIKGKLKTQSGDTMYPETSADKVIGLGAQVIVLEDNGSTTAGTWLAKTDRISSLVEGQLFLYKVAVAGASTTKLNITASGTALGAKTIYRYGTTKLTTQYAVGSYILLYYNGSTFTAVNDYDANSYAYVRQYQASASTTGKYPLLARYNTTDKANSYDTAYSRFHTEVTLDTSNGTLDAPAITVDGKDVATEDYVQDQIAEIDIPTKSSWNYDDTYVKYTASQSLTSDQKTQARSNIGAGTSNLALGNTSSTAAAGDHTHSSLKNGSYTASLPTLSANATIALKSDVEALGNPMTFQGSVGDSGTKTWANLPSAASSNKGHTYKVITAHSTAPVCKVGDTIISDGSSWVVIPSGDEPSGTVTSVGVSVPTGLSVSSSPVTSSGTIAISYASGYSLPTTAKQTEWDGKAAGDHTHANMAVTNADNNFSATQTFKNITLYSASGDSPRLTFQRGTLTDGYNDWSLYDSSGYLYIQQRGQSSSVWETRAVFDQNSANFQGTLKQGGKAVATQEWVEGKGYTTNVGTVTSVNGNSPDSNGNVSLSIPSAVTESTVSGWGFTKNEGTVKSVNSNSPDANGNVSITIPSYTSKTAASGGTDVSLVTTGEKYTWNNKANSSDIKVTNGTVSYNGTGEAVTSLSISDGQIVAERGATNYVTTNGTQTITGVKTFSASPVLNNNKFLTVKSTSNVTYAALGMDSSNILQLGNTLNALCINSSGIVRPHSNGGVNLGNSGFRWKTLYVSNGISDGTNTLTIPAKSGTIVVEDKSIVAWKGSILLHGSDETYGRPTFKGTVLYDKYAKKVRITGGFINRSGAGDAAKWRIDTLLAQVGLTKNDIRTPLGYDVGTAMVTSPSEDKIISTWMGYGATVRYDVNDTYGTDTPGLWFGRYCETRTDFWGEFSLYNFWNNAVVFTCNFTAELEVN